MEDTVDLAWRRQIVCVAGVHLSTAARPGSSGLREGGGAGVRDCLVVVGALKWCCWG